MFDTKYHRRFSDALLRAMGVILFVGGGVAMHVLFCRPQIAPRSDPTVMHYMLAACGFMGLSLGTALAWLGGHVYDEVPTSARWARLSARSSPGNVERVSPDDASAGCGWSAAGHDATCPTDPRTEHAV